jgi:hypothetical protein
VRTVTSKDVEYEEIYADWLKGSVDGQVKICSLSREGEWGGQLIHVRYDVDEQPVFHVISEGGPTVVAVSDLGVTITQQGWISKNPAGGIEFKRNRKTGGYKIRKLPFVEV